MCSLQCFGPLLTIDFATAWDVETTISACATLFVSANRGKNGR